MNFQVTVFIDAANHNLSFRTEAFIVSEPAFANNQTLLSNIVNSFRSRIQTVDTCGTYTFKLEGTFDDQGRVNHNFNVTLLDVTLLQDMSGPF